MVKKSTQLNMIYALAIGLGLALMIGESMRSYGMARPFFHWFDDFILAILLFLGVYKTKQNVKNIKFLSAAWGIVLVIIYRSYSSKVYNPDRSINSNLSFDLLTNLLLIATIVSIVGLLWTLLVDFSES